MAAVIATVMTICPNAGEAQYPTKAESLEPENVFVILETNNGWGKTKRTFLSCDGQFEILGAYSDTTSIHGTVSPDTALAIINEILAINFFKLPSEFSSSRTYIEKFDNGVLAVMSQTTFDAGSSRIELHVDSREHVVILNYPAYGAPEAIHIWVRRINEFMKGTLGW